VDAWSSASVGRATERGPVTPNCSEPGVAIVITRQAATSEASNAEKEEYERRGKLTARLKIEDNWIGLGLKFSVND